MTSSDGTQKKKNVAPAIVLPNVFHRPGSDPLEAVAIFRNGDIEIYPIDAGGVSVHLGADGIARLNRLVMMGGVWEVTDE